MRITKDQADENREHVIDVASQLFREGGFDGVSVADLMKASGFTHGGFYNHFRSKEELLAEALKRAFENMAGERSCSKNIRDSISKYLSDLHRRVRARGCPAAALAGDTSRQSEQVKSEFADGVEGMIRGFAQMLPNSMRKATKRRLSIDLVSRMVGALALVRAIPNNNPLGAEILSSVRVTCKEAVS